MERSPRSPQSSVRLVCQCNKFVGGPDRCRVVATKNACHSGDGQREHQRAGLAEFTCVGNCPVGICESGLRKAEQPRHPRPKRQCCGTEVMPKPGGKWTVLGGVVQFNHLTKMFSTFDE